MAWIIGFYALQIIALLVIGIISWLIWDKRFKSKQNDTVPVGFVKTDEVNIDPSTQKRQVVYFNPATGERFYKSE